MDEINLSLPPRLESALEGYYGGPIPDPDFAGRLETQLYQRHHEAANPGRHSLGQNPLKGRSLMQSLRARPLLAVIAAILALLALTGVVYAIGRAAGFVPGFGFTSGNGTVLVLAEPGEATVGEVTVQVVHAVSDDQRFWVEFSSSASPDLHDFPQATIELPDGQKVGFLQGQNSDGGNGATLFSFSFPTLEGQPQNPLLLIEGLGGQDFSLALSLRPIEAGEIIPSPPQEGQQLHSESHGGVSLVLDHIAQDPQKTVFQASLQKDQAGIWINGPWNMTLRGENGKVYPLTDITPATATDQDTRIYQTIPFRGDERLILQVVSFPIGDKLPMFMDFSPNSPSFTFDPGPNPQVGQTWPLDQTLSAGGYTLKIVQATLASATEFDFAAESAGPATGMMFYTTDPLLTGSGGTTSRESGNLVAGLTFSQIPDHPFVVQLSRINYTAEGPWQITWQPPAAPQPVEALPSATPRPTWTVVVTPTAQISDPLYLEVQRLAQQFDESLLKGPGWVHEVVEVTGNPRSDMDFPPAHMTSEYWTEIDAVGYVTRRVTQDRDDTGQILQEAATIGNYSVNITYGNSGFSDAPAYRLSLDLLTRTLAAALQDGATQVQQEQTTCDDGSACLLVTIQNFFPSPIQNPGEEHAFSGTGERVWINLASGQQVEDQTYWLLADGGAQNSRTTTVTLVEKVDSAPQEIQDIVESVVVP